MVTKLDRLARSVPDACDIVDDLPACVIRPNLDGFLHDPADPVGRLLFIVPSTIAEFEADPAWGRTPGGMAVAEAKSAAAREATEAQSQPPP